MNTQYRPWVSLGISEVEYWKKQYIEARMQLTGFEEQIECEDTQPELELERIFADTVNRHSLENESNTPDFIMGEFLASIVCAYNVAVRARDKWYGVELYPGRSADAPIATEINVEELLRQSVNRIQKLEQVVAELGAAESSKTSTKTGHIEPNSYSFTQEKLDEGEPTATYNPLPRITDLQTPATGLIGKKKKSYPMYPPPANQCGTKQGAAVALIADGVPATEALDQAGVSYVKGARNSGAASFCSVHRLHIKNMRDLPPGQARYDYLQKHYRWGA
jgi:hypothetical protein